MRRREFIAGLMFAAVTGRAQAQQTGKVYRIAFAHPTAPVTDLTQTSRGSLVTPAILEELIRLGYVEGRNLVIERYSGEGRAAHYPDLARQIVSRNPDLIITAPEVVCAELSFYRRFLVFYGLLGNGKTLVVARWQFPSYSLAFTWGPATGRRHDACNLSSLAA
jgi:hypothetical protein